jgi:hypothetical protein
MKKIYFLSLVLFTVHTFYGQDIPLPQNLPQTHPRLLAAPDGKPLLQDILDRIDPYVEKTQAQPDWMLSRLMMYWKSKATRVYIKGGVYSHADGEAPVPTVRFGSSRGQASVYKRPRLEDIIPYMDDTKGVYFHNSDKEGSPLEWGEQANASGIESINEQIMGIGKDAAFAYRLTGNEKYARFAFDLFDTYMTGMYYRNEPIDLNKGHAQTLVGLSTFEVIQERILNELAYLYDFLYDYIQKNYPGRRNNYEATFKKWMDITIKNGVPQNNWNLHQAKFILKAAMVLDDNRAYPDGKGREYYIDCILNKTSPRQWSLTKFTDYGYDKNTGVWAESPGYSQGVTRDLTNFVRDYDNTFNQNLLPYLPVLYKAVEMLPQYLFPNGHITAFGDTYYGGIHTEPFSDMIRMAQKYGDRDNEIRFTRMMKLFDADFTGKPLELDANIPTGKITDYITQTFYAPNVSWLVQRNQYDDPQNGLMISQYASLGNHAHANGVAIELYGKGYVLGAESGIGSSYFQPDYKEYYSQFPAHNTVMVDGVSSYPEMLSHHPFDLLSCYPQPQQKEGYYPGITFSDVYFLEPESQSDQRRFRSIVRNGKTSGYYIDIFRSRKQRGGEKFHDYFYHNLGRELVILDAQGQPLDLQPSEAMAFAGGHLFALDYMWDKQSAVTADDYQAVWKMAMPGGNHIYMNLWMKGYPGREVFSIQAPPAKSFREKNDIPYEVRKEPFLTLSARQQGEAWNRPFVAVFEPATEEEGKSVQSIESFEVNNVSPDFVGLIIHSKSGRKDCVFSSTKPETVDYNGFSVNATYALISENGNDYSLFLGNGTKIRAKGFTIEAGEKTTAILEYKDGAYYFTCDAPVTIITPKNKRINKNKTSYQKIQKIE